MRKIYLLSFILLIHTANLNAQSTTYNYTGSVQFYTVPSCVTAVTITALGAKGGGANGGNGASVTGTIAVTPGQILEVYVGGMGLCPGVGYNGGGNGTTANNAANASCGGGGASDVRVAPYALNNRIIVAAGGGGMGGGNTDALGGVGGCATGANGVSPFGQGGFGASQTAGGNGGPPWIMSGNAGLPGALGVGGTGGSDPCFNLGPGGGGGGGFYGGGGGGSDCFQTGSLGGGGGGGGSSLTPPGGTCTQGANNNNGQITITASGGLLVTFSPANPNICIGDSIQIVASGSVSYAWSPSGSLSNSNNDTVIAFPTSTETYQVIVSDGGACNDTVPLTVTVNTYPTVAIAPTTPTICAGGNIALTASGAATYSWSPATGLSATTGATVTASPGSTQTYTVTGSNAGCTGQQTITVTVNPNPIVTLNPLTATICNGQSVVLTAGGANSYAWTPATGLSGTTGSVVAATPASTQTYTVTGTNTFGCTATQNATITVNPQPTVTVNSPIMCAGAGTTLTATPSIAGGTYSWFPGGQTTQTISVNPASNTVYTVTYTLSGCTATNSGTVTVNPQPTVSVNDQTICAGGMATLTALPSISGGTYSWTPTGATTQVINVSPGSNTQYNATYTVNGCSYTDSAMVFVNPLPNVNAGNNVIICNGNTTQLTGTTTNGVSYSWSPSTGLNNDSIANPMAGPNSTVTYTLTVTDANGCVNTDQVTVTVNTVVAGFTATPQTGEPPLLVTFTNISSGNPVSYTWIYGDGNNITTGLTTTQNSFANAGEYNVVLIATDANGCSDTTSMLIVVEFPFNIFIPNVISPNGDGSNDGFEVVHKGVVGLEVSIFDRWGVYMYGSTDLNGKWNGTREGKDCPDGTYYYVVKVTTKANELKEYKGTVTLLR